MSLTHADLLLLVNYDPDTGVLTWLPRSKGFYLKNASYVEREVKRWNSRYAGKPIICDTGQGYIGLKIRRKTYKAHRLIWFYMTGNWPENIDHINGIRSDNRWVNLRDVSYLENNKNVRLRKDNISGCPGVSWVKKLGKWIAHIKDDGKQITLGYFSDLDEAIRVRKKKEVELNYHKNHGDRYVNR